MRNFILGSDWWTDCDDCVAMRLLSLAHKEGIINALCVGINACAEVSVRSLDSFLLSEGLDIPVGIDFEATDYLNGEQIKYQYTAEKLFKSKYKDNSEALDAVKLYRKALSECDGKCDIADIGFENILEKLLKSTADEYSPLDGIALVKEKVERLWLMAGKWDIDGGLEYNLCNMPRSRNAGKYVMENWPTEITYLGFEVGASVITGNTLLQDDNLKKLMTAHGSPNGRSSWDPLLVYLAIVNNTEKAGYDVVRGEASLDLADGKNHFVKSENGRHCYVVKKYPDSFYADAINRIIDSKRFII